MAQDSSKDTSKCMLLKLPAELHLAILRFLRPRDVLRFGTCCKEMLEIARSDDVWRDRVQDIVRTHLVTGAGQTDRTWTTSADADVYTAHVKTLLSTSARYLGWWASTATYRGRLFRISLRQKYDGTLRMIGESVQCRNGYVNSGNAEQHLPWKPEAAIWHGQLAYMLPENHPSPDAGYSVDVLEPVLEYKPLFYTEFLDPYTCSSLVGSPHSDQPIPFLPIYPVLALTHQRKLRDAPASSERFPRRTPDEEPSFPSKDSIRAGVLRSIDEWGQPIDNLQDAGGHTLAGSTLTAPAFYLEENDPDGEDENEYYEDDEEDRYSGLFDSGANHAARRYLYLSGFEKALPLKMRDGIFGESDISREEPEAFYPIQGPSITAIEPAPTPPDKPFLAADLQGMFVGCYAAHGMEFGRITLRNVWTRLHTADEVALEQIYDEDPDNENNADPSVAREPLAPGLEGSVKRRRSILEFVKITGDVNVPAGQVSWLAILPSQTSVQQPVTDMQQYLQDHPDPDLDTLVLPTVLRSDWEAWSNIPPTLARQHYAGTMSPRWSEGCVQAAGRIAYNGFMDTRFIDAQATFIREANGQVDEVRIRWPELGKVSCYRRCKI